MHQWLLFYTRRGHEVVILEGEYTEVCDLHALIFAKSDLFFFF